MNFKEYYCDLQGLIQRHMFTYALHMIAYCTTHISWGTALERR